MRPYRPDINEEEQKINDQRVTEYLKKELKFTESDIQQILHQQREHFLKTHERTRQIHHLKKQIMDLMVDPNSDSQKVKALTQQIGQITATHEWEVYNNFSTIFNLCKHKEKVKFKQLVRQIIEIMDPRPPRKRKNH